MRPGVRHPVLLLRRHETEHLVASAGLRHVRDPSNDDPAFQRNRVRHELLPLASEIARRDVAVVLSRQARLLADESTLLDELARELDVTDADLLASAPVALARRAVRAWLVDIGSDGYPPDAAAVERVLEVARRSVIACEVSGGVRIKRTRGRLVAELGEPKSAARREEYSHCVPELDAP
jgi:tRNA(Ile)-lysidine synthase